MADLLEKIGLRDLVSDVMDELLQVASSHKCVFASDFKEKTMQNMRDLTPEANTMFQDFTARRPMEIETYLGTPIKFARGAGIHVPRLQTLYAMLHHLNTTNQSRPPPPSPAAAQPPPRVTSVPPPPRPPMNGPGRGGRMSSGMGMQVPPSRRGPPPVNGYRGPPNGHPPRQLPRKPSFDENNLDEFSHVVLYDDIPEGDVAASYGDMPGGGAGQSPLDLRERELMIRQRELRLKEHEMAMRRGAGGRRNSHARPRDFDDDDDDDDYLDPMDIRVGAPPQIDPDNFDMMSVTSRRTRKTPSQAQLRKNVFEGGGGMRPGGGGFSRPHMGRNRASARLVNDATSGMHDNVLDNPMMSYSSNRYGAVDRKELHEESRANSLTASRMQEVGHGVGPYPAPPSRRTSQSPGNPFSPMGRGMGRPSPPNEGYPQSNGMPNGTGRPSPPGGMRAPVPRHPPGHGNAVHPRQVEQQVGVSKPFPPLKGPSKSLTGSASASAGSGDSGSANIESSEPSAHSSQSSFAPRHPVGAR
jgi:Ketopantoate reductase PanE/ApbA C terminal